MPLLELLSDFGHVGIRATKQRDLEWLSDALAPTPLVFEVGMRFCRASIPLAGFPERSTAIYSSNGEPMVDLKRTCFCTRDRR